MKYELEILFSGDRLLVLPITERNTHNTQYDSYCCNNHKS